MLHVSVCEKAVFPTSIRLLTEICSHLHSEDLDEFLHNLRNS